ncbi:gelsolin-related protein of 125 kDa-like [Halyomorpha halys]|uniref:gelsolin-related protein of 125 kDa-like n=1 Tax=Halyomorpha halys TaxID=286706 RepID=UPI0034D391C8
MNRLEKRMSEDFNRFFDRLENLEVICDNIVRRRRKEENIAVVNQVEEIAETEIKEFFNYDIDVETDTNENLEKEFIKYEGSDEKTEETLKKNKENMDKILNNNIETLECKLASRIEHLNNELEENSEEEIIKVSVPEAVKASEEPERPVKERNPNMCKIGHQEIRKEHNQIENTACEIESDEKLHLTPISLKEIFQKKNRPTSKAYVYLVKESIELKQFGLYKHVSGIRNKENSGKQEKIKGTNINGIERVLYISVPLTEDARNYLRGNVKKKF